MTFYRKPFLIAALFVLTFLPIQSHADLVSLALNPIPSGAPGATLSFHGTLTNLTSSTIFLVTPNLLQTGGLIPDFSSFTTLQLAPNAATGSILLFTAEIDAGTPVGTQIDALFAISGGTDPANPGVAAQEYFVVKVTAPSAAPEPGTLLLLPFGLAALGLACRSKAARH